MKKILLKSVPTGLTFAVAIVWFLGILILSMLAVIPNVEAIEPYLEKIGTAGSIAILFGWAGIVSWPMLRLYPAKAKR